MTSLDNSKELDTFTAVVMSFDCTVRIFFFSNLKMNQIYKNNALKQHETQSFHYPFFKNQINFFFFESGCHWQKKFR